MADPANWSRGELFTRGNEGCRLAAYRDSVGVWTIGYGATGAGIGPGTVWAQRWADHEFTVRYAAARFGARTDIGPAFFDDLTEARQAALVDMAYELGTHGLAEFTHLIAAVRDADWPAAVAAAQASRWSAQVPARAARVEAMLETGEFPA